MEALCRLHLSTRKLEDGTPLAGAKLTMVLAERKGLNDSSESVIVGGAYESQRSLEEKDPLGFNPSSLVTHSGLQQRQSITFQLASSSCRPVPVASGFCKDLGLLQ